MYLQYQFILESESESNDLQHDTLILPGRKPGRPRKDVPMTTDLQRIWRKDDDVLNNYTYNPNSEVTGINPDLFDLLKDGKPFDFFKLIVEKIVKETNNYAQQKINSTPLSKYSRLSKWTPTSIEEIHNWLELVMAMGLMEMREIEMYWSNTTLFSTSFRNIISRNRFQLLTQMFL